MDERDEPGKQDGAQHERKNDDEFAADSPEYKTQEAGADKDILRRCTHQPARDVLEQYTSFEWSRLCAQIQPLKNRAVRRMTAREERVKGLVRACYSRSASPFEKRSGGGGNRTRRAQVRRTCLSQSSAVLPMELRVAPGLIPGCSQSFAV